METFDGLIRESGVVCAVLCLPVLLAATLVGTVIAILQAATQIQEQTLTLLPKIVAVAVVVAVGGSFGMRLCAGLFAEAIARIPQIVSGG